MVGGDLAVVGATGAGQSSSASGSIPRLADL